MGAGNHGKQLAKSNLPGTTERNVPGAVRPTITWKQGAVPGPSGIAADSGLSDTKAMNANTAHVKHTDAPNFAVTIKLKMATDFCSSGGG